MKALGIIPARGGSKGVLRKNIRIVGGIPLIGHTIRAAQGSKRLARFVVSTDDDEIAETAARFGAQVVRRPADLARDDSPIDSAIRHARDAAGADYDTIALLQPTTPLRSSDDIDGALDLFAEGRADTVIGITQVGDTHPSRMYRLADGLMNPVLPEPAGRLRQQLEPIFIRNGAIYICSTAQLRATGSLFGPRLRGYVMPAERAVNIDEEIDLVVADCLLSKKAPGRPAGGKAAVLNLEPDGYCPQARAVLEAVASVDDGPLDRGALLSRVGNYDAIVVRFGHRIDNPVLDAGRKLRAIACAATGTDHIDVDAASARGIKVISLRGETEFLRGISASAECGWGLLVALMRRLPEAVTMGKSGRWNRDALRGRDLAGKRLAIIGCGRIGEKTATYAQAFGMQVAAFDPYRAEMPIGVERRPTIAAAVADADVVMVHPPLTAETRNLISVPEFAEMRRGAVLVNTARGAVIDEGALLAALESGQLSGAALDVLADEEPEALMRNPLLDWARRHDNLLITPHIAGASLDAMAATEIFIAEKLAAALRVPA